ncbi:hypothetical protein RclHR1_18830006 [Rhizophagus clarus]|uniref:DNA replication complex GINS protein PSF1 n=1 Tax=Rhizophagus clarus TaxID=94130 RepID=A0A2Z6RG75_9GLOM|nr:hypothetical protein RclHR1_18830006 [Rhizophagus clarus]GES85727.1 DNA replication complex GINS protein PSF1 [Rhizophagus clarus]
MYANSVVRPLIDITKRTQETKSILFYERDKVQGLCEEVNLLRQETEEVNDNNEYQSQEKIYVKNIIQKEKLNAIQLYHFQRIQKNKDAASRETRLTQNELNRLSDREQSFYKNYEQLIHDYKSKCPESLYISNELHAPKRPYVIVRVIENVGEVVTKNGIIELLKGSQTMVREADSIIAKLIKMGYLKKIDSY